MYSLNSFLSTRFENYKAQQKNKQNRTRMFAMDDRQLADIGITRGDLQLSTPKQPSKASLEAQARKAQRIEQKQAINDLRAMTDADLNDLGITRGNIVEAVRFGRNGLEEQPMSANIVRRTTRRDQKLAARELYAMGDAQLEDIGICRADIADMVRNGKAASSNRPGMLANGLAAVFKGPVVVNQTTEAAANADATKNAPKPPRNPLSRHVAA